MMMKWRMTKSCRPLRGLDAYLRHIPGVLLTLHPRLYSAARIRGLRTRQIVGKDKLLMNPARILSILVNRRTIGPAILSSVFSFVLATLFLLRSKQELFHSPNRCVFSLKERKAGAQTFSFFTRAPLHGHI